MEKVMPLTIADEATAFLGIKIEKINNIINLTQPKLIKQLIELLRMGDSNSASTPAVNDSLGSDINGPAFNEKWSHSSAVGMLMNLANNTRPDIVFATHQCARFTHAARHSHPLAVKQIIWYLLRTSDKGMILSPTKNFLVDCYPNADFAGLYGVEDDQDPICAKSCTGSVLYLTHCGLYGVEDDQDPICAKSCNSYVLYLTDCPLLRKLQTEVASSTMDAEYVALSSAMLDLIPLCHVVTLVCDTTLGKRSMKQKCSLQSLKTTTELCHWLAFHA
jgi:hypothetical protein